jgi:L-aminopeptidase/D-esterase-like protein
MTTITWTISQLDRRTSDGFVTTAHWRATAVDGDHSASIYSTCSWADVQPTVPYASLTEQQVLTWVWESVDKAATEAALAAQIALQKNPVSAAGVPWSA